MQPKGEDNPLVQAQITLSWDLDGPILNKLLTQPVMALNGTNAGVPGGAGGQSAAAALFAWDLLAPARSSYDDSEHDDDHDEHENDDMRRFSGAWPAGPAQNQAPNPVPLPLSAVLLLSAFPVLVLRRKLAAA